MLHHGIGKRLAYHELGKQQRGGLRRQEAVAGDEGVKLAEDGYVFLHSVWGRGLSG